MSVNQSWNAIMSSLANDTYSASNFTKFEIIDNCLLVRLGILGSTVSVAVTDDGAGRLSVGGHGSNVAARRWLHDVLVVGSKLQILKSGRELQVVHEHVKLENVVSAVKDCSEFLYSLRRQEERADFDPDSVVSMYWSSGVLNFWRLEWSSYRSFVDRPSAGASEPTWGRKPSLILGWLYPGLDKEE